MTLGTYPDMSVFLGNQDGLPAVKTCYEVYELNQAIKAGHQTCIVQVSENPKLRLSGFLLRNKFSGDYEVVSARRIYVQYGEIMEFSYDEWETICEISGYARAQKASSGWGAYILPFGTKIGDRVYIEDLIEDIFAYQFWYSVAVASDAVGFWNGSKIEIDESVYRKFEPVG